MLFIDNNNTNPYFNLAMEEYLLKELNEDIFILWRNEPAIIVGKNQNTISEINIDYVKEHSIPVVRRLTGGGAVFHDLGNINFTFISKDREEDLNDFRKFTKPILEVLQELSVEAEFSGRNDLTIKGKKFSGNAQCNYKNKVMHHGTLLFSSEITDLSAALKVKSIKFEGKSVKSVTSRVTNISEHLPNPITISEFRDKIMNHVVSSHGKNNIYHFTDKDLDSINKLVRDKYNTWDWNFGSSPKYSFENIIKFSGGTAEFHLDVKKGVIENIKIYGDFFGKENISLLEETLLGIKHNADEVRQRLSNFDITKYIHGITIDELINGLIGTEK
jgi:lipoate---protein ligase